MHDHNLSVSRRRRAAGPRALGALRIALFAATFLGGQQTFAQIQGYGVAATGGAGGSVCTVTTSAESGSGSFDSCIAKGGNQTIQFAVAVAKVRKTEYVKSNTTIDGCANGMNGVTLDQPGDTKRSVVIEGPVSNVIVRCLRFQGTGKKPGFTTEFDLLGLDGTGGLVSTVAIERCTFTGATDGALDITGYVNDVTVQRSLYYGNPLNQLIKYNTRQRISLHHNVYTNNGERNPQIKGDARNIDFVSNVIHQNTMSSDGVGNRYSPYGTRLWNAAAASDSPGNVTGNFVANAWVGQNAWLDIQTESGASAAGIYVSSNYCVPGSCPASPRPSPQPVPPANTVTVTLPTRMRSQLLPTVGAPNRTATDQAKIDAVAAALPCVVPELSVLDETTLEGDSGVKPLVFNLVLSTPSDCPVSVAVAAAGDTATQGTDFEAYSGTAWFPAGSTTQKVGVPVKGDRVLEADESLFLNLTNPDGLTLATTSAVGTIQNDDSPGFSVNDVSVVEPESGTTTASFTVTLAPTSGGPTSVNYATGNATAVAPSDYVAKSGTLSFSAGQATQVVNVTVNGDGLQENPETFLLTLSNPTGGPAVAASPGTASVFDPGSFMTVTPCRVLDTRNPNGPLGGPALVAGAARTFTFTGTCSIPSGARAVALNVAVTGPSAAGHLRVYPAGGPAPVAAAINYNAGQTRANDLTVALSASGQLTIGCYQVSGTTHVIVDVAGYYR